MILDGMARRSTAVCPLLAPRDKSPAGPCGARFLPPQIRFEARCTPFCHGLIIAAVLLTVLAPAKADFVNGGFENGLTGWTVQYAANKGTGVFAWQSSPLPGQSAAKAITSFTKDAFTLAPPCGGSMAQLNELNEQRRYAMRIFQTYVLTQDDLQGGCGVEVRLSWTTLLAWCTSVADSPTFRAEIRCNGIPRKATTLISKDLSQFAFIDDYGIHYEPVVFKTDAWEVPLPGTAAGDQITVEVTITGCAYDYHAGLAFLDCAQIVPLPVSYPALHAPAAWTSEAEPGDGWHVGDFNADGRDDLARETASGVEVLPSSGSAFAAPALWSSWVLGVGDTGFMVGDFDSNGAADLAALTPGVGIMVALSNGQTFLAPQLWIADPGPGFRPVEPLAAGDFNGDGADDLLFYDSASQITGVLQSEWAYFLPFKGWTTEKLSSDGSDWYIGDFDGDALADLARWQATGGTLRVLLSDGYKFLPAQTWSNHAPGARTILHAYSDQGFYVGDLNCDGLDDLLRVPPTGSTAFEILASTGSAFAAPQAWTSANADLSWYYVGDFDGTGSEDVVQWPVQGSGGVVRLSCSECSCTRVKARTPICSSSNGDIMTLGLVVWNLSSQPAYKLQFTSDGAWAGPIYYVFAWPFMPGTRKVISIPIHGVTPGLRTITVDLLDAGGDAICGDADTFQAPACACMQTNVTHVYCTTDGSGDMFIDFTVTNISGTVVTEIDLTPTPVWERCTPDVFYTSLPAGATSAVMTTRLSGPSSVGSPVHILFELKDSNGVVICSETLEFDVLDCPPAGWCCDPPKGCYPVGSPAACQGTFSTSKTVCNGCPISKDPGNKTTSVVPIDEGHVTLDGDGYVLLHHLNATGDNGASIQGPALDFLGLEWLPLPRFLFLDDGTFMRVVARGVIVGDELQELGSLTIVDAGDRGEIATDFSPLGANELFLRAFVEGEPTGELMVEPWTPVMSLIWPESLALITGTEEGGSTAFRLRWPGVVDVTVYDYALTCDELRIEAPPPAERAQYAASLDLTAGGLNYLAICRTSCQRLPCPLDRSGDRWVSLREFASLQNGFGRNTEGDLDGDADTDLEDWQILWQAFGNRCP